jgi:hypothetical protein
MSHMDSNKDYVLILEKSSTNLKPRVSGSEYILEGVCAVFGKENGNGRIYEENEYIPHMQYLTEKINSKRLVGELDHPKDFEVSLKNISHLVERLEYDKASRTVKIKVKLLDTPAGQIARSLVDAGIPVSISSRAAGTVMENKRVKIQKIFTYDLVADPGFENAQLGRVYESMGYTPTSNISESVISTLPNINEALGLRRNSNVQIYKIKDSKKIEKLLKENTVNKIKPAMDDNFVTSEELNQYSSLIKREFDSIKASISQLNSAIKEGKGSAPKSTKGIEARLANLEKYADYLAENIEASIEYSDYLAENLEITNKYTNYLAENLEGSIKYAEYLAENLDHNILYSEYIAENLSKNISYAEYLAENLDMNILYAEYLAENLDKSISFSDYLAENLDKSIQFSDYLSENVNKSITYAEYLAENLDKNITYSNYLAENLDKNIAYADYLGENLDKSINYTEYIGEKLSSNLDLTSYLEESIHGIKGVKAPLLESVKNAAKTGTRTSSYAGNYNNLEDKINKLIESVEKPKTAKSETAQKTKATENLNESRSLGSNMTEGKEGDPSLRFITRMPKDIKPIWESLSENKKASIVSLAALYNLESDYQIDYFWKARTDLYGIKENLERQNLSSLNESKENQVSNMPYSSEYMNYIAKSLEARFKK